MQNSESCVETPYVQESLRVALHGFLCGVATQAIQHGYFTHAAQPSTYSE